LGHGDRDRDYEEGLPSVEALVEEIIVEPGDLQYLHRYSIFATGLKFASLNLELIRRCGGCFHDSNSADVEACQCAYRFVEDKIKWNISSPQSRYW
jgi:hypothetical protein